MLRFNPAQQFELVYVFKVKSRLAASLKTLGKTFRFRAIKNYIYCYFSLHLIIFCPILKGKACLTASFSFTRTLLFYKNQQLSAQAGLFLIFWRIQPRIVLKLFLFPDIFKQ